MYIEALSSMPILMPNTDIMQKATERLRMRPWLEQQLTSDSIPGLKWIDKENGLFKIPWKHAARHGWDKDKDACLFMYWAIHTGKFNPDKGDKPRPKTWKANFRCALNSLPDIVEEPAKSLKRGNDAFKVYKLLPKKLADRKRKGTGTQSKPFKKTARINDRASNHQRINKTKTATINHCLRPRTRSMSMLKEETGHHREEKTQTMKPELQDHKDYVKTIKTEPTDSWTIATTQPSLPYTHASDPYPTPPQSAGFPLTITHSIHSIPNSFTSTIPSIMSPTMMTSPMTSPKSETFDQHSDVEYSMHIDDDVSSSTSSVPTDAEVIEIIDEMRQDSGPDSPVSYHHSADILLDLKSLENATTSWTESTVGGKCYLQNGEKPTCPPVTTSTNNISTATALDLTQLWLSNFDNQNNVPTCEEYPKLDGIPRPAYITVPGDMDDIDYTAVTTAAVLDGYFNTITTSAT